MLLLGGNSVMGEPTIRPPDRPVRRPYALSAKKKRWKRWTASTWAAIAAAGVSLVALGFSAHYSSAQNTLTKQGQIADERDRLLDITASIAQQLAQEQAATSRAGATTSHTGVAATTENTAILAVEAEASKPLIADLKGSHIVTAYEYIQVAQALEISGDRAGAFLMYKQAIASSYSNAVERSTALRYLGAFYYKLAMPTLGHQYLMRAAEAFKSALLADPYYKANSIAQAYLMDAYYQLTIPKGCSTAQHDMRSARRVRGLYAPTAAVQSYENVLKEAFQARCSGSL
jgi:predicted nucleic acid-binding protein